MFGCKKVIPPKFLDINKAWKGTDNASWLMRVKKRVQYLIAIGPRCDHWYCHTDEVPKTLFVFHGKGKLRYENTDGSERSTEPKEGFYLSRIQPWVRWHFAVTWPLFINWHVIFRKKNVVTAPTYQSEFGLNKMVTSGVGYKRDGDMWHILTANFGGNFE